MSHNSRFNKCNILGVEIDIVTMEKLVDYITSNLHEASGKYICVANVHTTVTANENPDYLLIQNNSWITIPDGGPLCSYAKKHGFSECERTTGPDLMEEILRLSELNGYSHYFYGSTRGTLDKLVNNISLDYPDVQIAGYLSPPFRKLTEDERTEVIDSINQANPDFIWIGLGAPKQEQFMFDNVNKFNGVMIGVGAAFDYKAGNIKRAPIWMQKLNLEWFFRLIQNPVKLYKRYLITNTKFIVKCLINKGQ